MRKRRLYFPLSSPRFPRPLTGLGLTPPVQPWNASMNPTDPPRRGRPKGSKTRPKWLRELEAQQPRRPRGRPKGSPNKPKTLEAWLTQAMAMDLPPKPPPRPKNQNKVRRESNALNRLTPEERSEQARKAALSRKTHGARAPGTPPTLGDPRICAAPQGSRARGQKDLQHHGNRGLPPRGPVGARGAPRGPQAPASSPATKSSSTRSPEPFSNIG
jgi:hypothetical protein